MSDVASMREKRCTEYESDARTEIEGEMRQKLSHTSSQPATPPHPQALSHTPHTHTHTLKPLAAPISVRQVFVQYLINLIYDKYT